MFGILLLILLAIFFAGKSNPQAPSYPPPPRPEKKDKTLLIIVIVVIVVIVVVLSAILVTMILAGSMYAWVSGLGPIETKTPFATLSYPTKTLVDSTYYYNMTVLSTTQPIDPNNVRVHLSNGIVYLNETREEYKQINSTIYVKWADTNLNNKFDTNDKLSIKTTTDLGGKSISLTYIPTGGVIAHTSLPY